MKRVELKVARIGNSRGVRIPAGTLARYRIGPTVIMEETAEGILLRPHGAPDTKLSWEETAREMAAASESWSEWDSATGDGLESAPWEDGKTKRVAEPRSGYRGRSGRTRR
jgi:antitoxin component of MazEF toxin-antitoxin module